MTLRQYLFIMTIATILCWIAWGFVIVNIDPFQGKGIGFGFFYLSLFLALFGTISLIAFTTRYLFSRLSLPMFRYVQKSFREAFLVSLILIILLYLQSQYYLNWWNVAALIIILILVGAFVWSSKRTRPPDQFIT